LGFLIRCSFRAMQITFTLPGGRTQKGSFAAECGGELAGSNVAGRWVA
jgi:hypothetical protein